MILDPVLSLGIILLLGFFSDKIADFFHIPHVTANLLLGILIGIELLDPLTHHLLRASGFISNIVLGLIAFSIGQSFYYKRFKAIGKQIILISLFEAGFAWIIVTLTFLLILRKPFYLSLIFGSIASATAPAATLMVIRQLKAKGIFTNMLMGVVAIDDAWCLIIFSFSFAISKALYLHASQGLHILLIILKAFLEIGGSVILGALVGLLFIRFSKLIKTPGGKEIFTLGFVFLTVGIAAHMHFSVLLASMALGSVVVNFHRNYSTFYESLRGVEPPLYLLFFVLAGANLEIASLKNLSIIGLTYLIIRVVGKLLGAYVGGTLSKAPKKVRKYLGFGLVPQAGVALGVALIAKAEFPEVGGMILDTIIATTVVYELVGPILTQFALVKSGEAVIPEK